MRPRRVVPRDELPIDCQIDGLFTSTRKQNKHPSATCKKSYFLRNFSPVLTYCTYYLAVPRGKQQQEGVRGSEEEEEDKIMLKNNSRLLSDERLTNERPARNMARVPQRETANSARQRYAKDTHTTNRHHTQQLQCTGARRR